MKPSENLALGRTMLIERGWTQNSGYQDDEGHICALTPLVILHLDVSESFERDCLERACKDLSGLDFEYQVAYFNDEVAQSAGQIVELYDRAILIAKQAEAD